MQSPDVVEAGAPILVRIGEQYEQLVPVTLVDHVLVTTEAEYRAVGERVVATRDYLRKVLLYWDGTDAEPGLVPKAYATWKEACDKRAAFTHPAEAQLQLDKAAMNAYLRMEEERARMAAEEEERRRQVAAQAQVLDAAVDLAATNDPACVAAADQMLERPVETAPAYIAPRVPQVSGLRAPSSRFEVSVDDARAVLLAAAAGEMVADLARLNGVSAQARKAVLAFLDAYRPAQGALAYAVKLDAAIDRKGIETVARRQGEKFSLAGVTAGRQKKV